MKTEEKIDRIVEKLEQMDSRLDCIDVTLVKQAGQLEHHIYRTALAEKHLRHLEAQIKPIEKHVIILNGVLKFIGGIAVLVGMIKAIVELINLF